MSSVCIEIIQRLRIDEELETATTNNYSHRKLINNGCQLEFHRLTIQSVFSNWILREEASRSPVLLPQHFNGKEEESQVLRIREIWQSSIAASCLTEQVQEDKHSNDVMCMLCICYRTPLEVAWKLRVQEFWCWWERWLDDNQPRATDDDLMCW